MNMFKKENCEICNAIVQTINCKYKCYNCGYISG